MKKCNYILESGKKCKHSCNGKYELCKLHQKGQSGGGISELVFPMGKSLGYLTFSLFRLNQMFQRNIDSKTQKKPKKIYKEDY